MELRLFFLPNFPGATFIQGATIIPDSRVTEELKPLSLFESFENILHKFWFWYNGGIIPPLVKT